MHTITLTHEQLYELSDAAGEVISRMLHKGQSETEIEMGALAALYEAYKTLNIAMLGTLATPAMEQLEPEVLAAINRPKKLRNE